MTAEELQNLMDRLPALWSEGTMTKLGVRRSWFFGGKEYDFRSLIDENTSEPSLSNPSWAIIGYSGPQVIPAQYLTTPNGKYNTADMSGLYSILIEELIGADLSFGTAHRDAGLSFSLSPNSAGKSSVQVDVNTGIVTFQQPFTDTPEDIWFDYKIQPDSGAAPLYFEPEFESEFE
jgi:hypothetical protein